MSSIVSKSRTFASKPSSQDGSASYAEAVSSLTASPPNRLRRPPSARSSPNKSSKHGRSISPPSSLVASSASPKKRSDATGETPQGTKSPKVPRSKAIEVDEEMKENPSSPQKSLRGKKLSSSVKESSTKEPSSPSDLIVISESSDNEITASNKKTTRRLENPSEDEQKLENSGDSPRPHHANRKKILAVKRQRRTPFLPESDEEQELSDSKAASASDQGDKSADSDLAGKRLKADRRPFNSLKGSEQKEMAVEPVSSGISNKGLTTPERPAPSSTAPAGSPAKATNLFGSGVIRVLASPSKRVFAGNGTGPPAAVNSSSDRPATFRTVTASPSAVVASFSPSKLSGGPTQFVTALLLIHFIGNDHYTGSNSSCRRIALVSDVSNAGNSEASSSPVQTALIAEQGYVALLSKMEGGGIYQLSNVVKRPKSTVNTYNLPFAAVEAEYYFQFGFQTAITPLSDVKGLESAAESALKEVQKKARLTDYITLIENLPSVEVNQKVCVIGVIHSVEPAQLGNQPGARSILMDSSKCFVSVTSFGVIPWRKGEVVLIFGALVASYLGSLQLTIYERRVILASWNPSDGQLFTHPAVIPARRQQSLIDLAQTIDIVPLSLQTSYDISLQTESSLTKLIQGGSEVPAVAPLEFSSLVKVRDSSTFAYRACIQKARDSEKFCFKGKNLSSSGLNPFVCKSGHQNSAYCVRWLFTAAFFDANDGYDIEKDTMPRSFYTVTVHHEDALLMLKDPENQLLMAIDEPTAQEGAEEAASLEISKMESKLVERFEAIIGKEYIVKIAMAGGEFNLLSIIREVHEDEKA